MALGVALVVVCSIWRALDLNASAFRNLSLSPLQTPRLHLPHPSAHPPSTSPIQNLHPPTDPSARSALSPMADINQDELIQSFCAVTGADPQQVGFSSSFSPASLTIRPGTPLTRSFRMGLAGETPPLQPRSSLSASSSQLCMTMADWFVSRLRLASFSKTTRIWESLVLWMAPTRRTMATSIRHHRLHPIPLQLPRLQRHLAHRKRSPSPRLGKHVAPVDPNYH